MLRFLNLVISPKWWKEFLTSVASLSEVEFHILMKVIRQFLLFAPCCILSFTKADFVGSNLGDPKRSFVGLLRMNLYRPSLGLWNTVLLSGILFCSQEYCFALQAPVFPSYSVLSRTDIHQRRFVVRIEVHLFLYSIQTFRMTANFPHSERRRATASRKLTKGISTLLNSFCLW